MAVSPAPTQGLPLTRIGGLVVSVALVGLGLAWTYLGMRAIMDIGGACATGGPYVPVQSCPAGASTLLSVGIPLLLMATFAASGLALWIKAPTLLLLMWFLLFGSLGWNFLEYALAEDDIVMGWLIPGIMFELMALPALLLWFGSGRLREYLMERPTSGGLRWKLVYVALVAVGAWIGLLSFDAWT
jgi:hypothetical protein